MTLFVKIATQIAAGVKREFLSRGKVRLILPWGFPYEAFGQSVTVKPWHILNLVESGRVLSFNRLPNYPNDSFLRVQDVCADFGAFMGSTRLNIAKEMYDLTLSKTPLTLEKELVYVGKSSMNLHTNVVLPSQDLTLASCEVQSVFVDYETRRPAPFPDWWMEKFGQFSTPGRQLKVGVQKAPEQIGAGCQRDSSKDPEVEGDQVSRHPTFTDGLYKEQPQAGLDMQHDQDLPITDSVTSFNMMVLNSDADAFGHANWTSFLKYCLDALMTGNSLEVRQTLQSYALKSADMSFVREGSVGQEITVKFWKDTEVPRAVHFNIVDSKTEQLMTYTLLQFYSLQEITLPAAKL